MFSVTPPFNISNVSSVYVPYQMTRQRTHSVEEVDADGIRSSLQSIQLALQTVHSEMHKLHTYIDNVKDYAQFASLNPGKTIADYENVMNVTSKMQQAIAQSASDEVPF